MAGKGFNFDELCAQLSGMPLKAQATFLHKYIFSMSPGLARTAQRYACGRLDEINRNLPEDHPSRIRYEERQKTYEKVMALQTVGIIVEDPKPWRGIFEDKVHADFQPDPLLPEPKYIMKGDEPL